MITTNSKGLAFSDITLIPAPFNEIRSRKDVDTSGNLCDKKYSLPVISSNMDTVYSPELAREVARMGGISCVHRFCSIEENVKLFKQGIYNNIKPWVSVGLSESEYERAVALRETGAEVVLIDVANAACPQGVEQYQKLREIYDEVVVGNFGTYDQIQAFISRAGSVPDMIKVSIGSGSMCTTRITTGVGLPSVTTIQDCKRAEIPMIFDGGVSNSGDFAKAIALGCTAVMCGKLFAATNESAGPEYRQTVNGIVPLETKMWPATHKLYRGSASLASYEVQGKVSEFRTPEGDQTIIKVTGSVEQLMNNLAGGLRSSMTYLNSKNLNEFRKNAKFLEISSNSQLESKPHGKE